MIINIRNCNRHWIEWLKWFLRIRILRLSLRQESLSQKSAEMIILNIFTSHFACHKQLLVYLQGLWQLVWHLLFDKRNHKLYLQRSFSVSKVYTSDNTGPTKRINPSQTERRELCIVHRASFLFDIFTIFPFGNFPNGNIICGVFVISFNWVFKYHKIRQYKMWF